MSSRFAILFVLASALSAQSSGQRGAMDPAFEKIPFDQWLGESAQAAFRFSASVPRATLSFHQRLVTQVDIQLDGRALESRRGKGELIFFLQITDRQGTRYQDHDSIDLEKVSENISAATVQYTHPAFFLPGDYRFAIAILVTSSGEHSTGQGAFRITSPAHNVLPDAWRNLPPVEFLAKVESPDSWYQPGIEGRLQWAASVDSPALINVVLNVAASAAAPGSRRTPSSGLPALLPTLKAITQTGSPALSQRVELLDLSRHRAVFQQDAPPDLDWPRLKASLSEANTASIDVHSLSDRHHDAQFFVSNVRRILRAATQPCVLVVLTTAVAFESGEDLEPISLEALPPCRVFYVRYRAPAQFISPFDQQMGRRGRGGRMGGSMSGYPASRPPVDQLEATLKPLNPKVFDVETAEQMAAVLAEVKKALP